MLVLQCLRKITIVFHNTPWCVPSKFTRPPVLFAFPFVVPRASPSFPGQGYFQARVNHETDRTETKTEPTEPRQTRQQFATSRPTEPNLTYRNTRQNNTRQQYLKKCSRSCNSCCCSCRCCCSCSSVRNDRTDRTEKPKVCETEPTDRVQHC